MDKPRILIFIDWFLPGYKAGGPVQSCSNLIEQLKDEFDFFVITRDTDYCENVPYDNVTSDTWNELGEHLRVYYTSQNNLTYKTIRQSALESKPDFIFINGIYSLYFSILPLLVARNFKRAKIIVSARGMLAPSAVNVKGSKKKLYLTFAKLMGLYNRVNFHATNEAEAEHIRNLFGSKYKIHVASNLPKTVRSVYSSIAKQGGNLKLVSVARISTEKNTKYALQVLRNFSFSGDIVFDIFGPIYSKEYWEECIEVINELPPNVKVTYKGSLENWKVSDVLQQYHVLFMPTRGENFGHIILESLASGRPVIISDQTPWRKLSNLNVGHDIPLDEPEIFAKVLQAFLDQRQDDYSKFSEAAYLYAQQVLQDKQALEQNRLLFS